MMPLPRCPLRRESARAAARFGSTALLAVTAACAALPSASGDVLFQDDFSRRASGWDAYREPGYTADYQDGAYRIWIEAPHRLAWGTPRFDLGDVRLEVDAAVAAGPLDNAFGLICRYQDPDNFYFFLISSDGYSGIGVVRDGRRSLLTGAAMLPNDHILQGRTANHLRADCVGSRLSLYVNGALANEAAADDWASGDFGVIAGTYGEGGLDVQFDNFAVLVP